MDPITHAVIGLSISKLTGNGIDLTNAAALGLTIGSVFPDIDIIMQKWGDYAYLKNHRGPSHSIVGLIVSSVLISAALSVILHENKLFAVFLWTLIGCLSHGFFDMFNSYGAKVLWPFTKRRYSFSVISSFDPIFMVTLPGYIFFKNKLQFLFIGVFIAYMISRVITKEIILKQLKSKFGKSYGKISVLPSMTGLCRWHFVMEGEDYNLIGEKNMLKRDITIIDKLKKLGKDELSKAVYSPLGNFFREFTPLFHVFCERVGKNTRYVFVDMRYYIKDDFLHHAILEIDDNDYIVEASFNPYSMRRCSNIPLHKLQSSEKTIT